MYKKAFLASLVTFGLSLGCSGTDSSTGPGGGGGSNSAGGANSAAAANVASVGSLPSAVQRLQRGHAERGRHQRFGGRFDGWSEFQRWRDGRHAGYRRRLERQSTNGWNEQRGRVHSRLGAPAPRQPAEPLLRPLAVHRRQVAPKLAAARLQRAAHPRQVEQRVLEDVMLGPAPRLGQAIVPLLRPRLAPRALG